MSAVRAQPAPSATFEAARPVPDPSWGELARRAPKMVATMRRYLGQLSVSARPTTVEATALALRHLASHVTEDDPTCKSVAAIERHHIEVYKVALAARPGKRGVNKTLSSTTIRHNLGLVRSFFERVIDWGYDDAPRR
jgi:hypothetical protein